MSVNVTLLQNNEGTLQALYVDGVLKAESNCITPQQVLEALRYEYTFVNTDPTDVGHYPHKLEDQIINQTLGEA